MRLLVHTNDPETIRDILHERLPQVSIAFCTDYAGLPAALNDHLPDVLYTVRFAGSAGFPRQAIVESPCLRWVSVGGSGTDHLAPWDPNRLTVTNAAGVGAETMAQYAIAAILHFTLNFPHFARAQREVCWLPTEVGSAKGLTLAILGLGKTGQAVVPLAKALGMRVIGIRANAGLAAPHVDRIATSGQLHEILSEADVVMVCLPSTERTRGLIGEREFAVVRPGAILIDVSRGGIVQQSALIDALRVGRLKGAALDVFEVEPLPRDNPLWAMPNVIITPHCSSVYRGWERRAIAMFCDNFGHWRCGEPLDNVVFPDRGY